MRYFGGKSQAGVYQLLINSIPPHRVYVEPFFGGGSIWRWKRPADQSIVCDLDENAMATTRQWAVDHGRQELCATTTFHHGCGIDFLESFPTFAPNDHFIYLDPPYMHSTRTSHHRYKHELSDQDHERLLYACNLIASPVMISHYPFPLYDARLASWHKLEYLVTLRSHRRAVECCWMNYPPPRRLHDDRYLGRDYTDRQRIHRKIHRWTSRLRAMPELERQAILAAIAHSHPRPGDPGDRNRKDHQ